MGPGAVSEYSPNNDFHLHASRPVGVSPVLAAVIPSEAPESKVQRMSHLSDHCRKRRRHLALSPAQLARLAGYRNINKGIRRIRDFEDGGRPDSEFLGKLVDALDIPQGEIDRVTAWDVQDWCENIDRPIQPHLLRTKYGPRIKLPPGVDTLEKAQAYARARALEIYRTVRLVWSRRTYVQYSPDGTVVYRRDSQYDRDGYYPSFVSPRGRRFSAIGVQSEGTGQSSPGGSGEPTSRGRRTELDIMVIKRVGAGRFARYVIAKGERYWTRDFIWGSPFKAIWYGSMQAAVDGRFNIEVSEALRGHGM